MEQVKEQKNLVKYKCFLMLVYSNRILIQYNVQYCTSVGIFGNFSLYCCVATHSEKFFQVVSNKNCGVLSVLSE